MQRSDEFMMIYAAMLANPNCGDVTPDHLIAKTAQHMRAIGEFTQRVESDPEFRMLHFGIDAESLEQAMSAREREQPSLEEMIEKVNALRQQHTPGENPQTDGTGVA